MAGGLMLHQCGTPMLAMGVAGGDGRGGLGVRRQGRLYPRAKHFI